MVCVVVSAIVTLLTPRMKLRSLARRRQSFSQRWTDPAFCARQTSRRLCVNRSDHFDIALHLPLAHGDLRPRERQARMVSASICRARSFSHSSLVIHGGTTLRAPPASAAWVSRSSARISLLLGASLSLG